MKGLDRQEPSYNVGDPGAAMTAKQKGPAKLLTN